MEDEKKKLKKKAKKSEKDEKVSLESSEKLDNGSEYMIQPESSTPKIDTSKWPLLLKHYDQLHVVCLFSEFLFLDKYFNNSLHLFRIENRPLYANTQWHVTFKAIFGGIYALWSYQFR